MSSTITTDTTTDVDAGLPGFTFRAAWPDGDNSPDPADVSELLDLIRTLVAERISDVQTRSSVVLQTSQSPQPTPRRTTTPRRPSKRARR